jgi:hypothetical protein
LHSIAFVLKCRKPLPYKALLSFLRTETSAINANKAHWSGSSGYDIGYRKNSGVAVDAFRSFSNLHGGQYQKFQPPCRTPEKSVVLWCAMGPHHHLFDAADVRRVRAEFLREARALPPGDERNEKRQVARGLKYLIHIQRDQPLAVLPRAKAAG